MKIKLLLLLLISNISAAGFFDNSMPTKIKMLDFYNNNFPNMLPLFEREERLASQNEDSIIDGDVEYLNVAGKEVFSIIIENEDKASKNSDTGIILLHTRGSHPNQESISSLCAYNWQRRDIIRYLYKCQY